MMDVIMPQLGETVVEGVVARWYKKVGDAVKADEMLFDVETDKVSTEIPAPASGIVTEILVAEGVTAKVGARLAVIRESGAGAGAMAFAAQPAGVATGAPQPAMAPAPHPAPAAAGGRLSPVVRRLIAEHGLNPADIRGTGRDGRLTRDDIIGYVERGGARGPAGTMRTEPPAVYSVGAQTRKPLNTVRKRTRDHMLKSWTTAPHVLQAVEVDFMKVEQARQAAGAAWKAREGFTLTYLPFVACAVSAALAKFPLLNASLDGDDLVLHPRINIGIAVDLNFEGLVVPVVKDVPGKSLPQLAREINDLAQRARNNRLKPDDMTGGTYTLSNSGVFGTLITAPIINQPQVAILSTDGVRKKPVVIEGPQGDSIAIRPVGVLAQTFDHRAIDGAYSAAFLREVMTLIETRDWTQELQG
ncbi:MAG: 2-oxo acid dehydrogenase subunit E2 [Betaproteobacteria bacterium]|nr:2-oxo acid dehydrogenase subunit E2 [Betaproteobacteria bacterium]MBI2226165.1 2-oxo acid dehydrogenase subunit E2 [Betaproteobacteria bacterium]